MALQQRTLKRLDNLDAMARELDIIGGKERVLLYQYNPGDGITRWVWNSRLEHITGTQKSLNKEGYTVISRLENYLQAKIIESKREQ